MKSTNIIKYNPSNTFLGDNLTSICDMLRTLSTRDFKIANERKNNPNILPISKNHFLRLLQASYTKDAKANLTETAAALIKKIKSEKQVGEYGRFSSYINSAEIINCGETVIYSPNDRNPSTLPEKQFTHSKTKVINMLVTAMGGCQEAWINHIDDMQIAQDVITFYNQHKTELEKILTLYQFLDRYNSFYIPDRMVNFTIKLPGNKTQALSVFDSNASNFKGGQWMFTAPSGLPLHGYVDRIINNTPYLLHALEYQLASGHRIPSYQSTDKDTKIIIDYIKQPAKLLKRSQSMITIAERKVDKISAISTLKKSASTPTLSHLDSKNRISGKDLVSHLNINENAPFAMSERGDLVFLLGTQLSSKYSIFQNPRGSASIPVHYHCYALNTDVLLEEKHAIKVPLFNAKVKTVLFKKEISHVPVKLEKLEWPCPSYRLAVPLQTNPSNYLPIAHYIQELINKTLKEKKNCTFSIISHRTNTEIELYLGFRDVIKHYPVPNKIAMVNNLQNPLNGTVEYAGINTMMNSQEFVKFKTIYLKDPIKGALLFNEIQHLSQSIYKACEADVMDFENYARLNY